MAIEAWTGVVGALVGGLAAISGTWLTHILQSRKQSRIDLARKKLLTTTLKGAEGAGWMSIQTLAQIVGANLDVTRALLIEIEARGSMKTNKEMWSLLSRNPLPRSSED
ncbi:hypothetical protein [Pararhizobium sp. IMCC21322]|uniref:hypothetical protein n=1 Tax=Pararhizobium sp. IMCC21322 TaxID=3067903 RepID=UPI002740D2F2|nr:hypothetical protein [Pararhizobium sp. IMCC21322]